ncbi:MAG: alanine/ornithine racemase family PLP-dependent enzyme [Cyclobacteriaceae bacterium]|nr:alanine/ornithine racemase family PLP-dependent enzyme [Cyclobacteriaceae bacterium]
MAFIKLYREKLQHNYRYLNSLFIENNISWAIVTKLLCGSKNYLQEVINLGIDEVCDARISNLKLIKSLNPNIQTVYIKPPAYRSIANIVRYADASFNTEYQTIKWLSEEAVSQDKLHKIIIMIELGDLREGVMGDHLLEFYESVFELPNIKVTGIGANLNCLYGVMPSEDKLIQLSLYKQLIEAKFNQQIPWVTGGTSVVLPLIFRRQIPIGVNHFRVGESLYFGNDLFTGEPIPGMVEDVFKLYAEVIEISEKPVVPSGYLDLNPSGEAFTIREEDYGRKSYRAILDLGVLDFSTTDYLIPEDDHVKITGASSDMMVIDLGEKEPEYKVGDLMSFRLKYMGALRLFNSNYVEKVVE